MNGIITPTKDEISPTIGSVTNVVEFTNGEFGKIRTVTIDGRPYFVANDVAKSLGYKDVINAIKQHCRWVVKHDIPHPQSKTKTIEVNVIPEGDIYRLVASSQLPNAEKFESWLFDEVLPTIRKTGGYVNNDELFINTYLPFAEESTKVLFLQSLQTVREQNEIIQRQQTEIKEQKQEIVHKEDVIIGLVGDIDLATKRQRITQIVRHCKNKQYKERYRLLYGEFERKYHCNLKLRMESDILKPKARNTMDYIDRGMNMIPELYEVACKLFENDVEELKAEWDFVVA